MNEKITYDRPVKARLVVQLDNKEHEQWDATDNDVRKFGFVDPHATERRLDEWIWAAFTRHTGEAEPENGLRASRIGPLLYAVECALHYDRMPTDEYGDAVVRLTLGDPEPKETESTS